MLKKAILLILCTVILFTTGCAAIIEGEYSASSEHTSSMSQEQRVAEATAEASNYSSIRAAVQSFVDSRVEYGVIKFDTYYGDDLEADLSKACLYVANESPMGSYAVYYINHSLNKIVSYYEAGISIMYKRTEKKMDGVVELWDNQNLRGYLKRALETRTDSVTFLVDEKMTENYVSGLLEDIYYSSPETVLYFPNYSVTFYPEAGKESIMEVSLIFPYTTLTSDQRLESVNDQVRQIAEGIEGTTAEERISEICAWFAQNITFDSDTEKAENYSRWYNTYTSYGALVQKHAVGEGFAVAMKLVCDKLKIECTVVRGRLNNVSHAWNIVRLENGEYYHLDSTNTDSARLFKTDEEMKENYWWDASMYPQCIGDTLYPEYVPANTENGNQNEEGEKPDEGTIPSEPIEGEEPTQPDEPDDPDDPQPVDPDNPDDEQNN